VNLILIVGFIGHIKRDQGWLPFSRLLVASRPVRDLLLCAKHLFFDAMVVAIAPAGSQSYARQAFDQGAVAAILMIPTALSACGAINPGVHVGGAVNPGATVRGAVERGIPGPDLGTWRSPSGQVHRSRKHSKAATKQRR
jgi:hypothetical protein